jgi:MFS family permease
LLSLTIGQQIGFGSLPIVLLFVGATIFLALFLVIERSVTHPMVDLRLFRNELFSTSLIMAFVSFISIAGTVLLVPFYLENILGYDTRNVGFLMAVVPVLLGITAPISGVLSDRFGPRPITVVGLLFLVVGYFSLTMLNEHTTMVGYIILFVPIGIGMGIFQSPNNSAIMGVAPKSQLGVVSGILAESRVLGQTIGMAIIGAFWASRVFAHGSEILEGGATVASVRAQITGLHDTFLMIGVVMMVNLGLGIWGLVQSRKRIVCT